MATKQLTRQSVETSISTEQSQKLVQTMLTMSFGCLAFLRGLFPDESFIDQRFVPEKVDKNYDKNTSSQSSSIKVKTLVRGRSNEVDTLLDWLEQGVFKSIKMRYLKALSMGIFLDENHPNELIENYVFGFSYDENDNVSLTINNGNDPSTSSPPQPGKETISLLDSRKMAQQLMRRFIIITQSLDPLPQKKYLTMRLMFNERTDPNYQPILFRDATYEKQATIRIPASLDKDMIEVGTLDTKIHKLTMNVLSSLELKDDEEFAEIDPFDVLNKEQEQVEEDNSMRESETKEESQTTNILGDILKSSQFSLQPTQAILPATKKNSLPQCECKEHISTNNTALKTCEICGKVVHGLCYGNYHGQKIDSCIQCLCGPEFNYDNSDFNDLMMIRRCYRYLARSKGMFPSSLNLFYNRITRNKENDPATIESFQFCISALFFDSILYIDDPNNSTSTQSQLKIPLSSVPENFKSILSSPNQRLEPGRFYSIKVRFGSPKSTNYYLSPLASSKNEILTWIEQVKALKRQYRTLLAETYNIEKLSINDNQQTDESGNNKRRKSPSLETASIPLDTQELFKDLATVDKPKKYRKISISKKTLRSVW